jgi:signal transduction histidine kinase
VYLADPRGNASFVATGIWYLTDPDGFHDLIERTAHMHLDAAEGLAGRVVSTRTAQWLPDVRDDPALAARLGDADLGVQGVLAFPLLVGDHVRGVVELFACDRVEPSTDLLLTLRQIGTQLGRILERRELNRRVLHATEEEQRRLGRELHESLAQQLTGLGLLAESLHGELATKQRSEAAKARELCDHLHDAKEQIRAVARRLNPVEVDAEGLTTALEALTRTIRELHGVECVLVCESPVLVDDNVIASLLFHVAREAIDVAIRRRHARKIMLFLAQRENELALEASDDGERDEPPESAPHVQLMRYRTQLVGGRLAVRSDESGTTVTCVLPRGPAGGFS